MDVRALVARDADDVARGDEARARLLRKRRIVIMAVAAIVTFLIHSGIVAERLFEPDEGVRRLLFERRAEPVVRKPAKRRRARYEDDGDNVTTPRVGNAKWFRAWESSVYADYTRLKPADYYDEHPDSDAVLRREFESKVRMPLRLYQRLRDEMTSDNAMRERDTAVPLELKLIASLRFLAVGSGWDAIEDAMNISRPVLSKWFDERFIPWMLRHKYPLHVRHAETEEELAALMAPWREAGFPGCVGCCDATHIRYGGFEAFDKWKYCGKGGVPTLTVNCTTDFWGRFIHVSHLSPGSENDKTLIKSDAFQSRVMVDNPLYTKANFTLQTSHTQNEQHEGVYVLTDGGYCGWRTTVSPIAHPRPGSAEERWNKHHESLRKNVECAFGIIKIRFRVLRSTILRRDTNAVEDMFKVCACLHNMLIDERLARRAQLAPDQLERDWRRADAEELAHFARRMPEEIVHVAAAAPCAESTRELRKLQHALASHNTFYMHARASIDAMRPGEDGLREHIVRGMV